MKWKAFITRFREESNTRDQQQQLDVDAIWQAIEGEVTELNRKKRRRRILLWLFLSTGIALLLLTIHLLLAAEDVIDIAQTETSEVHLIQPPIVSTTPLDQTISNGARVTSHEIEPYLIDLDSSEQVPTTPMVGLSQTVVESDIHRSLDDTTANQVQGEFSTIHSSSTTENRLGLNPGISHKLPDIQSRTTKASPAINSYPPQRLAIEERNLPAPQFSILQSELATLTAHRSKFSLLAYTGAAFLKRRLNSKSYQADDLLQIRETYEDPMYAINYGFAMQLQQRSGFHFSLGLQRNMITDRYQIQTTQTTTDTIEGVRLIRININGDSIPIRGMINQQTTSELNKRIYNSYDLINIPLMLGYQRQFGDFSLGAEVGIFINLDLNTKGIIPDANLQDQVLGSDSPLALFKPRIGLGYYFGLSLEHRLWNNWKLSLRPNLSLFPNDFANSDYGLSQTYFQLGANLGLRYQF
ncbi:MAG: hypothetical protein AAF433_01470 [Bacteroidota bacterium]